MEFNEIEAYLCSPLQMYGKTLLHYIPRGLETNICSAKESLSYCKCFKTKQTKLLSKLKNVNKLLSKSNKVTNFSVIVEKLLVNSKQTYQWCKQSYQLL